MTAVLAILARAWPYLLCSIAAGYLTHRIDQTSYARLQAEYAGYRVQVADADAKAQQAARDTLQGQIDNRLKTEATNGKVIAQLQAERDSAAADRDFARRLLAAAKAGSIPAGGRVPETSHQPGAPAAGPASGNGSLVELVGASVDECRANARQLNALIEEIQPQL